MDQALEPTTPRNSRAAASRSIAGILGTLIVTILLHYLRPYVLPASVNSFMSRHAADRILFVLPVAIAAGAFGKAWSLATLAVVVLAMMPRSLLVSPSPTDALIETAAVAGVGYFVIHVIDAQARERALRQTAVARQLELQQRLSDVAEQISSELELDRILTTVLEIAQGLTGADAGGIALFDHEHSCIYYPYLHNLPQELANVPIPKGRGVAGQVLDTGRPIVVQDYPAYKDAIPAFVNAGVISMIAVPIVSGDNAFGALALSSIDQATLFTDGDVTVLAGIGRQTGIAIQNARLYESMRFYARQITRAQEDERQRIARDVHDETIQTLIAISRRLEALNSSIRQPGRSATRQLASLLDLIASAIEGMRRLIRDLRPPTLDHLGLVAAVESLANKLTQEHAIETEIILSGERRRLTPEEELVLFRIAQQALNNTSRHADASRVEIHIAFHSRHVRMTISDDGQGFNVPARVNDLASEGKLGLVGMNERAQTLGGTFTIQSEPGRGTRATVEIPQHPLQDSGSDPQVDCRHVEKNGVQATDPGKGHEHTDH